MNQPKTTTTASDEKSFQPVLKKIDKQILLPLLQSAEKPGRYTGGEFGIPVKDPMNVRSRSVFCYPDIYEIGMSNQGLKILYDRINKHDDFLADRVFLPWPDFAELLKENNIPLYSLDHGLEIRSFDFVGFNISHELAFTNLLYFLELSGIPRKWKDRTSEDPFILAGGTALSNPYPIFDFMDGIFVGDGEEAVVEIHEIIARAKEAGKSRPEILRELLNVEGLFIPAFYEMTDDSSVPVYFGPKVKKRTYRAKDYSDFKFQVLPNIEIIQDRAVIEVARGCGQGCRFCHAGFWKRPVRNSAVDDLVRNAENLLKLTGSDSIALHSLSIADYPFLEELVSQLAEKFAPNGISLSLPSLRVQVKTIPILMMTSKIRKSGITFALEAGSELQRERIRKKSSEENLQYLLKEMFSRGWDLVKVYFMLGLPDPDAMEVDDIIHALNALGEIAERSGRNKNVNVTVSMFVPKPYTTFQWERQADPDYFLDSIRKIKDGMKSKRVHLKYPYPWMAYVEGLLSRSDSRAGRYIEMAYDKGARFDSWDDRFDKNIWQEVLEEIPAELKKSWLEASEPGSRRFWDDVIEGFPVERLIRDYDKFAAITQENMNPPKKQILDESEFPPELLKPVEIPAEKFKTKFFLSVEYAKSWPFSHVSHLDTAEIFRKAMRRAGFPMTFSNGFNKHEILHFTEPLPIYFNSESERYYVELYDALDIGIASEELRRQLPGGLAVKEVQLKRHLPTHHNLPIKYRLDFTEISDAVSAEEKLRNAPQSISFEKKRRKKKHKALPQIRTVERKLSEALSEIHRMDASLYFTIDHPNTDAISITDLLSHFFEYPVTQWNVRFLITRIGYGK